MINSYKPLRLSEWVSREITTVKRADHTDTQKEIKELRIKILRRKLAHYIMQTLIEFKKWIQSLNIRELNTLLFLFEEVRTQEQKNIVVKELSNLAQSSRQLFTNSLDCFYRTEKTNPYWILAKVAYSENRARISKRWTDEEVKDWDQFMQQKTDQEEYIVQKILATEEPFSKVCADFRLYESHSFYRTIIIKMFESSERAFFETEKELFKSCFLQSSIDDKQRLVDAFVRSGSLHYIEDISHIIYEKMSTHMRRPQLWNSIKLENKTAFHSWAMLQNIREFFSGLDKNHQRFIYWEKFIPKMINAIVLKKENTVLFYFEDVVIMEILGTGAVYVYDLDYFSKRFQWKVDMFIEEEEKNAVTGQFYNSVRITRDYFMDKDKVIRGGWLSHNARWQEKFDDFLSRQLNWEVDRDAILQQSKRQFTI